MAATPRFATSLIFEDNGGLPFTLVQPLVYLSRVTAALGHVRTITVPTGFKTDLASIPRVFWRVLPPIGKYDAGAVVHDYLYQYNGVTRKQADDVLREAMTVLGVGRFPRWMIYVGVSTGGWKPWNTYRRRIETLNG